MLQSSKHLLTTEIFTFKHKNLLLMDSILSFSSLSLWIYLKISTYKHLLFPIHFTTVFAIFILFILPAISTLDVKMQKSCSTPSKHETWYQLSITSINVLIDLFILLLTSHKRELKFHRILAIHVVRAGVAIIIDRANVSDIYTQKELIISPKSCSKKYEAQYYFIRYQKLH